MAWQPYDSRGRPNTPKSDPHDISLLAEPLRSRAAQMIADCPYPGELGVVSAVRDPGTQWDLRLQRVGLANIWNAAVKGSPTTAVPARWNPDTQKWEGGSRHQEGTAVDFGGTERAMRWFSDNRERYGIARTVPKERWHGEANRRDVLTGRVHDNPTVTIAPYGHDQEDIDMTSEELIATLDAVLDPIRKDLAEVKRQVSQSQDAKAPGGRTLRHICASDLAKD